MSITPPSQQTNNQPWYEHHLVVQFMEYLVGGGIYFFLGISIFALGFDVLHWSWLIAKGLGDVIGWTINYVIQRYWAFNDKRLEHKDGRIIYRYIIVNGADLVIDYAIVAAFIYHHITPYAGFVVSALAVMAWNYFWYRFWVFKTGSTHTSK